MVEVLKPSLTSRPIFQWTVSVLILLVVVTIALTPLFDRSHMGPHSVPAIEDVRTLDLAMFQYANDHNGAYPTGKSSTEVFQKLINDGYVSDPSIFYCTDLKIPGKFPAASNAKVLKPENVCWDVTADLNLNSPDELPAVFSTGYQINYIPGGNAVPLFQPSDGRPPGIAVCYHSNSASFELIDKLPDGMVTNFISATFVPGGKTYQQLTPDGPLSP
jgi:hypothetical protein